MIWVLILVLCILIITVDCLNRETSYIKLNSNGKVLKNGDWCDTYEEESISSDSLVFINQSVDNISSEYVSVKDVNTGSLESKTIIADDFTSNVHAEMSFVLTADNTPVESDNLVQYDGRNKSEFVFSDNVTSKTCATSIPVDVPNMSIFENAGVVRMKVSDHEIPKIIHMNWGLWDDGGLPERAQKLLDEWKLALPEHKFIIWDKKKSYNFILEEFPIWVPIWNSCTRKVMLSDLLRTLVVYRYGGMYRDIDLVNKVDIKSVWEKRGTVLFTETIMGQAEADLVGVNEPIRRGKPEELVRVANYAFASAPFEPFLYFLLHEMRIRFDLPVKNDYDILYITGPALWSTIYDTHKSCATLIDLENSHNMIEHLAFGTWRDDKDG